MLEELGCDVLVRGIFARQLERDEQHRAAEERHPRRAVGLLEMPTGRQRLGPIEDPDVVETEEPAAEQVVAFGVLAIHPPREVDQQLVERALEELAIAMPARSGHAVHAIARPRVHGRIHVVERELVGGQLAVGVHVPLAQQQEHLTLRELGIDLRERHDVKREIPRREPGVLPLVGNGHDVARVNVPPVRVPAR